MHTAPWLTLVVATVLAPSASACGIWLTDMRFRGDAIFSDKGFDRASCELKCAEISGCTHLRLRPKDGKCEVLSGDKELSFKSGSEALEVCSESSTPPPPPGSLATVAAYCVLPFWPASGPCLV